MNVNTIFATIHCTNLATATEWYTRLFDRDPDAAPMDGLKEWHLSDGSGMQLVEDHHRAGQGAATLGVSRIEGFAKRMTQPGMPIGDIIQGDAARILMLTDPDGNQIVLAEALEG
ncbi:MAG: hypothetical protein DI616_10625 [Paracoccus denitrificans]|uniref:VOC family protein n=1 Tax=Paracoccus denitrificans TaxID=266 RepID=A0A533I7H5_PARDE|nr:MAG: hypothetical protein DI616_10625 [Paracoccus denitrificans]